MRDRIELHAHFPVTPVELFDAWLDSEKHAAMSGSAASCSRDPGARFTAWDGYITGCNLEIERPRRIVQSWRTSEFSATDPDSRLELRFVHSASGGTDFTLIHTGFPPGSFEEYQQGWLEFYLTSMQEYFKI